MGNFNGNDNEEYFGLKGEENQNINNSTESHGINNEDNASNYVGNNDYNRNEEPKKEKKNSKKGIAGTVAVAITASLIGGGIGGLGVYTAMNDSKDDDKKVEAGATPVAVTPQFKATEGAMTTAEAVQAVTPAVVGVSTKTLVRDQYFNGAREQEGIGSGFIISDEGLVVTNYHVVKGAQEVKVILSDGKEVAAKVVNYDEKADLAVVDITEHMKMPGVAKLGDSSKLLAGEDVIAIGNPLGKEFSKTVTKGIISSPNRKLSVNGSPEDVETFIQTDAAINPGNSGGPLINSKGEVIGVNTAKKVGEEIEGIGFSIPINTVKEKLDSLSKPILVLGITARDITPEISKEQNLPEGVYIQSISDFSPAEKAGLRIGDVITAYNGKPIKNLADLSASKESSKEGDVIDITVVRGGKNLNLELKLEAF
ncbi:MAG: S1C family serine protease [Sarcina sp.]